MKSIHYLIIVLLASSCAHTLPSKKERGTTFIVDTKNSAEGAYLRALDYIAANPQHTIISQDQKKKSFVFNGIMKCNVFKGSNDPKDYYLNFTLDLSFKGDAGRFSYEDLRITDDQNKMVENKTNQITNYHQVRKAKECLQPLQNDLVD